MNHLATFRVVLNGNVFFVKETGQNKELFMAENQIHKLKNANSLIQEWVAEKKLGFQIEVARYHLAWTTPQRSFLETDFYKGETLAETSFFNEFRLPINLRWVAKDIREMLADYGFDDATKENMIYSPREKKLVIFDLF